MPGGKSSTMPDDLVERLRRAYGTQSCDLCLNAEGGIRDSVVYIRCGRGDCAREAANRAEAADRITALTARLAALEQAAGEDVVEMAARAVADETTTECKGPLCVGDTCVCKRQARAVLARIAPTLRAQALQPIETAPRDRPIIVYAPARDGLPEMASMCQWHPDAGFCIDEIREPTHWMEKPTIRAGGSGG